MRVDRDGGYALVAAVAAIAAFAFIAYQVIAADQGAIALAGARVQQARLKAAADAGVALAISALAAENQGARWSLDGRTHTVEFGGATLTIRVEDEWGKAPLAGLSDAQARALFSGAGAGDRTDALVREFRAWQEDDPSPLSTRAPAVTPVRYGPFRTVGELAALRDMDGAVFARLAPVVTTFFEEDGGFDAEHASPLARAAMRAADGETAEQIGSEPDIESQRPTEELADERTVGRPMTVRVVARAPDGARAERMQIVELTGDPRQPYWIRYTQ